MCYTMDGGTIMDTILEDIKKIISENIKEYLPDVELEDLEENGTIYYMNGQNGTEWDYYVNKHIYSIVHNIF